MQLRVTFRPALLAFILVGCDNFRPFERIGIITPAKAGYESCRILRGESLADGGSFFLEFETKPHSVMKLIYRGSIFDAAETRLFVVTPDGKRRELQRGDPAIQTLQTMLRKAVAGTPKSQMRWGNIPRPIDDPFTALNRELGHKHFVAKCALTVLAEWKKKSS